MAIKLSDLSPAAREQIKLKHPETAQSRAKRVNQDPGLPDELLAQLRMLKLPKPVRELRFHDVRMWRFDIAWPEAKFAVEVDGGTWNEGGHVRGKHYESDCVKGCEAALLGWRVMHVTTDMVKDGRAADYVERYLRA